MEQALEERIRERAYEIWNATGKTHGQADEQWLDAEREVLAAGGLSTKPISPRKSPSRARPVARRGQSASGLATAPTVHSSLGSM
jgi:Protein of unknown function (DUF2934)